MLISELEAKLKEIKEKHGDCEVCINCNYDALWIKIDSIEHVTNEFFYHCPSESKKVFL